jgi:hypothetical protein
LNIFRDLDEKWSIPGHEAKKSGCTLRRNFLRYLRAFASTDDSLGVDGMVFPGLGMCCEVVDDLCVSCAVENLLSLLNFCTLRKERKSEVCGRIERE